MINDNLVKLKFREGYRILRYRERTIGDFPIQDVPIEFEYFFAAYIEEVRHFMSLIQEEHELDENKLESMHLKNCPYWTKLAYKHASHPKIRILEPEALVLKITMSGLIVNADFKSSLPDLDTYLCMDTQTPKKAIFRVPTGAFDEKTITLDVKEWKTLNFYYNPMNHKYCTFSSRFTFYYFPYENSLKIYNRVRYFK